MIEQNSNCKCKCSEIITKKGVSRCRYCGKVRNLYKPEPKPVVEVTKPKKKVETPAKTMPIKPKPTYHKKLSQVKVPKETKPKSKPRKKTGRRKGTTSKSRK